ncbi:MAG: PTS sugar transporter subunit IIA [Pseudomonadota bacterium]
MNLSNLLSVEQIEFGYEAKSKKRTLERVAELLSTGFPSASAFAIAEGFFARERLGSTGLGHGIALPHTRAEDATRPLAAFLRLAAPVDFDAPDRQPVDIVVGLIVPKEANDTHLQVLAHLASLFQEPTTREKLRNLRSPAKILDLLTRSPTTGG